MCQSAELSRVRAIAFKRFAVWLRSDFSASNFTMTGYLTTHVLDTAHGCPAVGVAIALWSISDEGDHLLLAQVTTNEDGRTDAPLLTDSGFKVGTYELVFSVGSYFAQFNQAAPNPPFLDEIPLRFSVANSAAHYHVPLLVSPWSYSTYRGS